jgi:TldD protein
MEVASVDVRSGVAVFRVTDADRIQRGRIESPLEPCLVRVDGRAALSRLSRVAADLTFDSCIGSCVRQGQTLATSVGAPTLCIGLVTVFSWRGPT